MSMMKVGSLIRIQKICDNIIFRMDRAKEKQEKLATPIDAKAEFEIIEMDLKQIKKIIDDVEV